MAFTPKAPEGAIRARSVDVDPTDVGQNQTALNRRLALDKTVSDFRDQEFRRTIRQHGKVLIWRKAVLCPCLNPETLQAAVDCTLCEASGYAYVDPIEIQALVLSAERNIKIYERFGEWAEGSAFATVEPEHRLGYRDKLEMKDTVMPYQEFIKKGNRRGRRALLPAGTDAARYRIHRMTYAAVKDGSTLLQLVEGVHYQINANGWIEWLRAGNEAVTDGTVVSLVYESHPTYIVVSHANVWRDDVISTKRPEPVHTALPLRAMLKLDYLVNSTTPLEQ